MEPLPLAQSHRIDFRCGDIFRQGDGLPGKFRFQRRGQRIVLLSRVQQIGPQHGVLTDGRLGQMIAFQQMKQLLRSVDDQGDGFQHRLQLRQNVVLIHPTAHQIPQKGHTPQFQRRGQQGDFF